MHDFFASEQTKHHTKREANKQMEACRTRNWSISGMKMPCVDMRWFENRCTMKPRLNSTAYLQHIVAGMW
jgi:hypothetical protein